MEERKNSSCVIPGDIITYDILTRVPTESLLRFRCVCKSWSRLFLDNPLFMKLHSQRYDNKSSSSGLIGVKYELDSISLECISSLVFINRIGKQRRIIPFKSTNTLFNTKFYILQSLNGILLLLYKEYHRYKYYVYNPITCCSTIIPLPIDDLIPDERNCFYLCYDRLIEKHKVVFCGPYRSSNRHESSPFLPKIKIITVGEDSDQWRDIVVPDAFHLSDVNFYVDRFYLFGSSSYFHRNCKPRDYLYGMIKLRDSDEYYILVLDATREVYVKIKLPNEVSTLKLKCVLSEMEGLLCLSHYTKETHELRVWTLKDYNCDEDDHEWAEIRFNFSMEEIKGKFMVSATQALTILTVPKKKLIFEHCTDTHPDYSYSDVYTYYSYDIELKQLEIIHSPTIPLHWHVNSFANC